MNITHSRKKYLCLFLLFISSISFAQETYSVIYPTPQSVNLVPGKFVTVPALSIKKGMLTADLQVLLGETFKINTQPSGFSLQVTALKSPKPVTGAYELNITEKGLQIAANDDRGKFYALQSLLQLVKKGRGDERYLPLGRISDYPDVAFRGTVEGFYGEPWHHEDRLSQFRFYGRMKLNTYIYGPKDDPYHSSPNWRQPYPEKEAALIKELVVEAAKNRVDFVWAIHPGKDIKWNHADSVAVLEKFDAMYKLGVRAFAVFFDDISGVGTDAKKQAGLLNYIQREFVSKRKDVGALIMCPTEYNKSWSNPKPGTYLDILGAELDKAVFIMWTGDRVIADNTKSGLQWVNNRIKRPAYVWWNFPVSDYVRDHLLMGPSYGLDTDAKHEMSGFVSNPMDKAEASLVALFGVADYAWNLKAYQPQLAWEAANRFVMPQAPAAFALFNAHNSDLGPNGHGYRRTESVEMKPTFEAYLAAWSIGQYPQGEANKISAEFEKITAAAAEITLKNDNARLQEQIKPWLIQFSHLGKAGAAAVQSAANWEDKAYASSWKSYLKTSNYLDSMVLVDQTYNQNPYQPGVKTGSLVLTPFVKQVFETMGKRFINEGKEETTKSDDAVPATQTVLMTNSEKLKQQPLQITNSNVAISPVLEVLKLNPGEYFGIRLNKSLQMAAVEFNLEANDPMSWGRLEISKDGSQWIPLTVEQKRGKGKVTQFAEGTSYVRFINHSDQVQNIYLKQFKFDVKAAAGVATPDYAFDRNISTYQEFSANKDLEVKLPKDFQKSSVKLLLKSDGVSYRLFGQTKADKRTLVYEGNEEYLQLDAGLLKKCVALYFTTASTGTLRLYEIQQAK